uniref:Zinc finger, CCHC-type n=1 Tax=Tanacetum cinerariifolium TaxID=118510 RepID=A0A6L2MXS6_TANCI|nr:zinc finger, CCHC-type [Tanacetum cinerariifolium]
MGLICQLRLGVRSVGSVSEMVGKWYGAVGYKRDALGKMHSEFGSGPRRQKTMRDAAAQTRVLAQETTKTNQALDIISLKRRVKKLEKKANKKTHKLNRLYKIGFSRRIETSDEASLGDQEDASKQRRILDNLDADEGVTLVDETQRRNDLDMFNIGVLDDKEVVAEKEVSNVDPVTTAGEVVTTVGVEVSAAATTLIISMDDITLAKALAALKSAKPMVKEPSVSIRAASTLPKVSVVSTTSTTVTKTTKAKGIVMKEPDETTIRTTTTKDQIMIDEEVAINLEAQLQAELEEEERLALKDRAEGSKTRVERSSKRAGEELEYDKSKKQKLDNKVEAEEDNDQEEVEMKMYMKIVFDDEKLVKAKYGNTRPEEAYEKVLWGDLKMKSYLDTLERLGYVMPYALGVSLILNSLNKNYDQFVQNYNMHSIGKAIAELHAMLKLHEKGIPKKAETPDVLAIREGKIQKDKKKPQGAKGKDKGKNKLAYAPKPKIPPPPKRDNLAKDFVCHYCKEGLRESEKLKHGALSLYVGNGMCATIEAIGSFDLVLPSGLMIVLDKCHYAPTISRGVVLISHLVNNSYIHTFTNYGIFVSKDNVFYFIAIPHDGHEKALKFSCLRVWGCEALVKQDTPNKLDPRSIKCIFVGYPKETTGYYFYYPLENMIFVARNAEFFENSLMVQEASGSRRLLESSRSDEGLELIQKEDTQPFKNTSKVRNEVTPIKVEP